MYFEMRDELEKIALSRYEKEIQRGTISRSQVVPGSINSPDGMLGAAGRIQARRQLQNTQIADPVQLARQRRISELQHSAALSNPKINPSADIKGHNFPGMGPATLHTGYGNPSVHAPTSSGQFVRSFGEGTIGKARAIASVDPRLKAVSPYLPLPQQQPVDATLNHAVLGHELGEAHEMRRPMGEQVPLASHRGARPLMNERLLSAHDPEATAAFDRLRTTHPDDVLGQKAMRQAGYVPGRPLPVGGKAEKAVGNIITRQASKLSPDTRGKALGLGAATGQYARIVPPHIQEGVNMAKAEIPNAASAIKTGFKGKNLGAMWGGVKSLAGGIKKLAPAAKWLT